jgi:hypothetical protein
MATERPKADAFRAEVAARWYADGLSPEAWAARYAHTIGCSSLDEVRYEDPAIDAFIQRVHAILRQPSLVRHLREALLTPEERARIEKESLEDF